ncbi:MAG: efflux RND transporter periplasmic adaptor subunit [Sphingobium sp.]|uniref:efflux RND transporter periplasmic adaptor subunit n=1 Tax=Sphingobium sp. TaxID=1912891 RepID=UPI0029AEE15B|nr:efflux RND transporter periplasmic adaptor subunit [Sphingobium sp.]MDX3910707.1 efflux RND transporter periplasmic adaptor subunit [Sphingobium sp.]
MTFCSLRRCRTLALLSSALAFTSACGSDQSAQQTAAAPPPTVLVIPVTTTRVANIIELPGRIEAVRTAEVRARVDGIVERRLYNEGTDVKAGSALFLIDPRDKRAQLQQATAALNRAQAARMNASSVVNRYGPLVSRKAVSAQEYDAALSDLRQAEASVLDARAAVDRARLELEYTTVRAPISGRVGRAEVTEGALVSAASATMMTTVNQLSPIYATFAQSSSELLDFQQQIRSGALKVPSLSAVQVRLILENGQDYGIVGHLNFADLSVEPSTGSQAVRAQFPNPNRTLLPGQFVRGRIEAGTIGNGIRVPSRAVQISNEEATVSTVNSEGIVAKRTVELGGQMGTDWIIRAGLKTGERVIVEGWQKVQPGQKVTAKRARISGSTPASR